MADVKTDPKEEAIKASLAAAQRDAVKRGIDTGQPKFRMLGAYIALMGYDVFQEQNMIFDPKKIWTAMEDLSAKGVIHSDKSSIDDINKVLRQNISASPDALTRMLAFAQNDKASLQIEIMQQGLGARNHPVPVTGTMTRQTVNALNAVMEAGTSPAAPVAAVAAKPAIPFKGEDLVMQAQLRVLGVKIGVDGRNGDQTKKFVAEFARKNNIDPADDQAVRAEIAKQAALAAMTPDKINGLISFGDRNDIKAGQVAYNVQHPDAHIRVTGVKDDATMAAVASAARVSVENPVAQARLSNLASTVGSTESVKGMSDADREVALRELQTGLKAAGYDVKITGVSDDATRNASVRYIFDHPDRPISAPGALAASGAPADPARAATNLSFGTGSAGDFVSQFERQVEEARRNRPVAPAFAAPDARG